MQKSLFGKCNADKFTWTAKNLIFKQLKRFLPPPPGFGSVTVWSGRCGLPALLSFWQHVAPADVSPPPAGSPLDGSLL